MGQQKTTIGRDRSHRAWVGPAIMALPPVLVLMVLAILSHIYDNEYSTDKLCATSVHIGETIELHLQAKADYLVLIAEEIAAGHIDESRFQERLTKYVTHHPYLINVTWADKDFVIQTTAPYEPNKQVVGLSLSLPEPKRASREAALTMLPVWTEPFEVIQGKAAIEVYVPIFRGDEFIGTLGGVHSINGMFDDLLPEKLRDKYSFVIADSENRCYGVDAKLGLSDFNLTESVMINLAGNQVTLVVAAYENERHWSLLGLILLCIFLIVGMAYSIMTLKKRLMEQRETEVALMESEKRATALLEAIPDLFFRLNRQGVYLDYKGAKSELLIAAPETIIGQRSSDLLPPKLAKFIDQKIKLTLDSGKIQAFEYQMSIPKRGRIDFEARMVQSSDDEVIATVRDVTERKRAVDQLRKTKDRFEKIITHSPIPIVVTDEKGTLEYLNNAFVEVFGYTMDDISTADQWWQTCYPDEKYRQQVKDAWGEAITEAIKNGTQIETQEWDLTCKDMSICRVEFNMMPLGDISVVTMNDLTETKRLQALESRAERLETAGTIAGQVAHDFNNLLAPMMAYPDFIREELPKDHPTLQYLEQIENAAQKITDINQQLLTLGRRGHYNQDVLNINSIIHQAVSEIIPHSDNITCKIDLEPVLMNILGGGSQIHRVITNLLSNAVDAIQGNGDISIKSENYYIEELAHNYARIPKGEYIKLTLSDTGCGMSDSIANKIFDPFYTTKTSDKRRGSGLGMSVVDAVIKDHNGYLDMETESGKGTTFYIYFPITRELLAADISDQTIGGCERILVIDDDEIQREVTSQLLVRLGYKVEIIESGEQAVELLREQTFDLVILDMVMPGGIDGTETYERIKKINQNQKAIIVSGFSETDRAQAARELGVGQFVKKPLTKQAIAASVRAELDCDKKVAIL